MKPALKPLRQQTLVITGASSGIGLATARKAAKAGAAVMLVARDEAALRAAVQDIRAKGGRAEHVVADVSDEDDVLRVVDATVRLLGGFDTWINDAGVAIYAPLAETSTADHARLFQTNYWGVVYGSKAAVAHLKERGGGALINVGSLASDIGTPNFGAYTASKHAVKGFTDSLRIELLREKAPISVTLIKPSGIDTPIADNAHNQLGGEAQVPPPLYAPSLVADAILHAAVTPKRDIIVGGVGMMQIMFATHFPWLADRLSTGAADILVDKSKPDRSVDNLNRPGTEGGRESVKTGGRAFSAYTYTQTHPRLAAGVGAAFLGGLLFAALLSRPDARHAVEAGAGDLRRRARKGSRRIAKRSAAFAEEVRRHAPDLPDLKDLRSAAGRLAGALPHELPPEFSRRLRRETNRARARLEDAWPH